MHDPVQHETTHIIIDRGQIDEETGKPLFWSNEDGWGDFRSSTLFEESETDSFPLPIGIDVHWERFWDHVPA